MVRRAAQRIGVALRLLAACAVLASLARADEVIPLAALSAEHQSFRLPGDGPWDYVTYDPAHDRVLIGRFDGVQVVRAETGRLEATIGARTGDHGAVIAASEQRLFTSDARARRLGVYNLDSLASQGEVRLGGEPDGLTYDPASHRVLAFLPGRHEIVAVDARNLHVAGRTDVGGEPEAGVVDGRGVVFVTLRDRGEVVRLNAATLQVTARWRTGCERPSPIAFDGARGRLFVGCRDRRMLVLDAGSGRVIAAVPTGGGTDALALDPGRHLVVAANGGGSITLVHVDVPDGAAVEGSIPMPQGARTMALDPSTGRVFTVTADVASIEPPTPTRPYPRLIPKPGTFRLIVMQLPR